MILTHEVMLQKSTMVTKVSSREREKQSMKVQT